VLNAFIWVYKNTTESQKSIVFDRTESFISESKVIVSKFSDHFAYKFIERLPDFSNLNYNLNEKINHKDQRIWTV
jgi:hypothetical protein